MAPLTVDPVSFDGAGTAVIGVGGGLAAAITGLTTALAGSSGMAGDDPAGAEIGRNYDNSAPKLIEAMVTTRNGLCRLGDGVRMSAHNYSVAEAKSDLSGGGDPLPMPPLTAPVSAGSPPSSVGTGSGAPAGWAWVAPYIGMIWPTGDSAKLRAAAAAWVTAGTNFGVTEIQGTGGSLGPIRAQHLPEGDAIDAAFTDAYQSTTRIVEACQKVADQLNAYADKVDKVHAAILDLLSRICDPLTGLKEVWDILTDKDEDEIKKIARDIRTIVDNFTAEVQALGREIGQVLSDAENVVTTMAKHAAKEWDQFLHGTPVGRVLNQIGQFYKGEAGEGYDSVKDNVQYGIARAVVDPLSFYHDWDQRLEGMAPLVGLGGDGAPSVGQSWKDFGKGIVHWDEWSKNPAEAAGKSVVDIASAVVGGKGMSELGKALRVTHDLKPPEVPEPHPAAGEPKPHSTGPSGGKPGPAPDATKPHPGSEQPPSQGKPEPAPPGKPGSAPPSSGTPHSPTEHKPPTGNKPVVGEPPKAPGKPTPSKLGQVPAGEGKSTDLSAGTSSANGQHPQSAPASPLPKAPASTAPHAPAPPFAPPHTGGLPPESPPSGPPGGHSPETSAPNSGGPHGGHPPEVPNQGAPHGLGENGGAHSHDGDAGGNHAIALNSNDLAALADYTGPGYRELNEALRSEMVDASQQARVSALNEALEKLPKYEGPVLRGTNLPPEALAEYQPGEIITEDAFTSTTTSQAVAKAFGGNVEFRILSSTGRDVSSISRFPYEQEVLFPSKTKFYVVSKMVDAITGKTIIEMIDLGR